jgi:hypothetical protein
VLTLTITGVAADSRAAGGKGGKTGRRTLSAGALFTGGLVGAVAVQHGGPAPPLLFAALLLVAATVTALAGLVGLARPPERLPTGRALTPGSAGRTTSCGRPTRGWCSAGWQVQAVARPALRAVVMRTMRSAWTRAASRVVWSTGLLPWASTWEVP